MSPKSVTSRASEAAERLNVRSALNPALWLCGIVTIPALVAASVMQKAPLWLEALAIAPVALACIGFLFFMCFDRDKLQSESYQLRKRALEVIEEKGGSIQLLSADDLQLITNPDLPLLTDERMLGSKDSAQ